MNGKLTMTALGARQAEGKNGRGPQGSTRLRVALLTRKWSVRGGNERVATALARQLLLRGHSVEVYCHCADETAEGIIAPDLVRTVPGLGFDPSLAMLSFAFATRRTVLGLRRRGAVDLVIGFNHSIVQDLYRLGGGTHAEFLRRTERFPAARGGPVLDRVALAVERARFRSRNTSFFVAPSLRVKQELAEHYGVEDARVRVVPNGVDLQRFSLDDDEAARRSTRARWGVGPDRDVALFVGQDLERKGFRPAARAAAAAGFELVCVGRERPPPDVRCAHWDGERRDVELAYRAADALLLPSHYDPFGGVVLEAYASGLPVVATRRIGATELAKGSPLDALLVESPDEVEAMVAALRQARAQGPGLRKAARSLALSHGEEAWGKRMEALVSEIAAKTRGSS